MVEVTASLQHVRCVSIGASRVGVSHVHVGDSVLAYQSTVCVSIFSVATFIYRLVQRDPNDNPLASRDNYQCIGIGVPAYDLYRHLHINEQSSMYSALTYWQRHISRHICIRVALASCSAVKSW